ncbi:MAG: hypothetical protein Q8O24_02445 [Gallionellaceae bacterium]|nr:hypothetical protein [Gallionellaceae bacterium]
MDWMQRPTVLTYADNRYFKVSSVIISVAIFAFVLFDPDGRVPFGGTALGYTLGISSATIVVILFYYGLFKRRPPKQLERRAASRQTDHPTQTAESSASAANQKTRGRRSFRSRMTWRYHVTLEGWLSAHIYLGGTLLVLATLHTGFRFSWSVHTLSYALLMIVSISGYYGLYIYTLYPRIMTQILGADTLSGIIKQIAELDEMARIRALDMPDDVNELLLKSRQETHIGSNLYQMLTGEQLNCPTTYAAKQIQVLGAKYVKNDQIKIISELYALILRKKTLVNRAHIAVMLKARMDAWLYLHVPFSVALMASLSVHVLAILLYW